MPPWDLLALKYRHAIIHSNAANGGGELFEFGVTIILGIADVSKIAGFAGQHREISSLDQRWNSMTCQGTQLRPFSLTP